MDRQTDAKHGDDHPDNPGDQLVHGIVFAQLHVSECYRAHHHSVEFSTEFVEKTFADELEDIGNQVHGACRASAVV